MRINGTIGSDYLLSGTDGNDVIYGYQGDDYLVGRGGRDILAGGPGNDALTDDDYQSGVFGEPTISDDRMYGGSGNDTLESGGGNDLLEGGDGNDTLFGDWDGTGRLHGGRGDDTIYGSGLISGGDGNDFVWGIGRIYGDAGDDHLEGGGLVIGGGGNDWVQGITSADHAELKGQGGADTFGIVFQANDVTTQHVVIDDFHPQFGDKLDVRGIVYDPTTGSSTEWSHGNLFGTYDQQPQPDGTMAQDGVIRAGDFSVGQTQDGSLILYFYEDSVELKGVHEIHAEDWIPNQPQDFLL